MELRARGKESGDFREAGHLPGGAAVVEPPAVRDGTELRDIRAGLFHSFQ
jgi:hypothetical protein